MEDAGIASYASYMVIVVEGTTLLSPSPLSIIGYVPRLMKHLTLNARIFRVLYSYTNVYVGREGKDH